MTIKINKTFVVGRTDSSIALSDFNKSILECFI